MSEDTQKMSEEVKAEYTSSLADLKFNSKPLINMLTMLAEENITYAREIVEAIEKHLAKVDTDVKLPILYLIDCIVKNVGSTYMALFSQNIVSTFCNVFKVVDEKTRAEMFKLRQTWNEVFPQKKLYAIDVQISMLDPAWPVTAQPPTNSIHFNPKFLKNTTGSSNQLTDIKPPIIPVSTATNVAPETISMQQQLIMKQKELLELQQKKLELELLQNQMKLQEQIHGKGKNLSGQPQNILVKREVANQLLSHMQPPVPGTMKIRPPVTVANSVIQQRLQQAAAAATGTPKINPVNSALIAASSNKPIRDPRILRQQQQIQQQQQLSTATSHQDDPKRRSPLSSTHVETKSAILDSSNKIVNNKLNVRESARAKPRLINNKESVPSQNKLNLPRPKSSSSRTSQSQKPFRSSSSRIKGSGSESSDSKSSSLKSSGSSSSSLDLPVKSKLEKLESKLSSKVSGLKHNKKKDSPIKGEKTIVKEATRGRESPKIHKIEVLSSTFKAAKSSKNRNYIRRNRSPPSPDSAKDVDLRVTGPPEKHARLQTDSPEDKSKTIDLTSPTKDVDLRQIPAIVGKKRHSIESPENTAKKSKTEIFDQLFGNEDTDLRQLPIVSDRPKTPPPPIISSNAQKEIEKEKESPKKNSNLEAVRAKLAMATNKGKIMKSFHKNHLNGNKDEDLRPPAPSDILNKIIISPEEEKCIKEGNVSNEQGQQIMNKIFAQIETQKLREAQKKDKEDSIINTSLQPISDDELLSDSDEDRLRTSRKFSQKGDKDERIFPEKTEVLVENKTAIMSPVHEDRGDKDERIPTLHPPFEEKYPRFGRDYRERDLRGSWRGGRRRWMDGGPSVQHGRGLARRMNVGGNWRPVGPHVYHRNVPPPDFAQPDFSQQSDFNQPPDFIPPPDFIQPSDFNKPPDFNQPTDNSGPPFSCDNTGKLSPELPANLIVESVSQDENRTMNIDGVPRDIRYYDETAVVFMNWDDPRELAFQEGERGVIFGDKEIYQLYFNQPALEVLVNGMPHQVKLGAPTREIIIDGKPYECYFGGPGIVIDLDGQPTSVKLQGPPPQVKIGLVKRTELVLAKINLIIDAKVVIPIFVDGKLQKFIFNGETHTLKFVDGLKCVVINDVKSDVEFGGLPKPFVLHGKKYFIRFTVLPKGVQPGHVYLKDMEGCTVDMKPIMDEDSQDAAPVMDTNEPALPVISKKRKLKREGSPDSNSNSASLFQNFLRNPLGNLDALSSHLMSMAPAVPVSTASTGYHIENRATNPDNTQPGGAPPELPAHKPSVDINELFQKLVATGMVTTNKHQSSSGPMPSATTSSAASVGALVARPSLHSRHMDTALMHASSDSSKSSKRHYAMDCLQPVSFARPESLKVRQPMLYEVLYAGMQCSGCGMRFPPEQSIQYSQHLDWHFRQNRKGKKNIRVAASRRWCYSFEDWLNYEEIEDLEEREKSYFDQQQTEGQAEELEEEVEIPSVPAIPEIPYAQCDVCMDIFDQFFNEEKEEWHLRNAIRVDGKTYHPVCYKDYQESVLESSMNDSKADETEDSQSANTEDKMIPGLEVVNLDDDDDEEMPDESKEEVLTEEVKSPVNGNSEAEPETKTEEPPEEMEDDDDVIIHEVVPEKIVVDDDDDDYIGDECSNLSQPELSHRRIPQPDDGFMDVEDALPSLKSGGLIKVKTEPMDKEELPDPTYDENEINSDEPVPVIEADEPLDTPQPVKRITGPALTSSIDGNVELDSGLASTANLSGRIKINISKPISVITAKETARDGVGDDNLKNMLLDPSQPLPPGEEPVQLNLKPALQGIELKKLPPVQKGTELTGMCSIM